MGPKNILILSSQVGAGHAAIANALQQYLSLLPQKHQVTILNTSLNLSSPTYRLVGEYFQEFHKKHWQMTNTPQAAKLIHLLNTPLVAPKIAKTIKASSPDLIITTTAFATFELKAALDLCQLNLPHLVVIADPFTLHHSWTTYKTADHYLAPTSEAKKLLIKRGIAPRKITVTGLPLRLGVFRPSLSQKQAHRQLNLSTDKLTLFIGGSGEGQGHIYSLTRQLLNQPSIQAKAQLLVVTGKNKLLYSRLKAVAKKSPQTLKVYGYTQLIESLLIASDLVVGKPGPNILFESLMLKKPFITTGKPISQELGNYQYIARHQLGIVTNKTSRTIQAILALVNQPDRLKAFLPHIQKHRRLYQQTPQRTLKLIRRFLTKNQP
jgi:processive 1,2-diacylglycerol beta-glucosyltransferase